MALGVVSERLADLNSEFLRSRSGALAVDGTSGGSLVSTVVLAAAVTGATEVLLQRILVPVASHIPSTPAGSPVLSTIDSTADLAVGATAALIVVAAVGIAVQLWADHPTLSLFVMFAAGSTLVSMLMTSITVPIVNHLVVISAAAAVVIRARLTIRGWHLGGVVLVAVGIAAGQWPLLADSLPILGPNVVLTARTAAELSLLAALVMFAVGAFRGRRRGAMLAAALAASAAGLLIASRPDYVAIMSLWAVGATLSLPPVLYIVAAGCLGLLLWTWLGTPTSRGLAAALILLAVAGLQPAVVHHNLTALIALAVLALPITSRGAPRGLEA